MKVFCLLALLVAAGQADDSPADQLIDELIYEVTDQFKKDAKQTITLPELDFDLKKKVAFFKLKGEFKAQGGYLRDLSTLKRTGPVSVTQGNGTVTLGLALGLSTLEFGFSQYSAEIFHVGIHGEMQVNVGVNSVKGQLTMRFPDQGPCHSTLDSISVDQLDGIQVHMTGLGRDGDLVYNLVLQYLVNKYHDKIRQEITNHMQKPIIDALQKNDICNKFPF